MSVFLPLFKALTKFRFNTFRIRISVIKNSLFRHLLMSWQELCTVYFSMYNLPSLRQLAYYITSCGICQALFKTFFKVFLLDSPLCDNRWYNTTKFFICQHFFWKIFKFFQPLLFCTFNWILFTILLLNLKKRECKENKFLTSPGTIKV